MADRSDDPLWGLTGTERRIMGRLLQMPPEQQKAAPKPISPQAEAQRRRRQKEREAGATASGGA
ncbi:MAG: hypothetical protein ACYDB1_11805 [Acidiferrobacteraceae bacterium]